MIRKQVSAILLAAIVTGSIGSCWAESGSMTASGLEVSAEAAVHAGTGDHTDEAKPLAVNIHACYNHIQNKNYDTKAADGIDTLPYLMYLKCEYPEILAGGTEALKASLREYQRAQGEHLEKLRKQGEENIAQALQENFTFGFPWANAYAVSMGRADETVFSFWQNFYFDEGGAHPTSVSAGMNYDAQTGKLLSLEDVVTDKEALCQYVLRTLRDLKEERGLFDDYEDTVRSLFDPAKAEDPALVWVLGKDGLNLYFNVYDIAPYAAGPLDIVIPYDQCSACVRASFIPGAEANVREVPVYAPVSFDADGDGIEEELCLAVLGAPEQDGFTVTVNYGKPGNTGSAEKAGYIQYDRAYLMRNADGKYYLYVQAVESNDYHYLMLFDLSDPQAGPIAMETYFPDSFYSFVPIDAEHFYMCRRMEALGTCGGYREFRIGENGMPEALQDTYTILRGKDMEYDLTAKQEIKGENGTIAQGEACAVICAAVDENGAVTTVSLQTKDNTQVTLKLDPRTADSYGETINGVNVTDLFDGIRYAG